MNFLEQFFQILIGAWVFVYQEDSTSYRDFLVTSRDRSSSLSPVDIQSGVLHAVNDSVVSFF